jgi:hypothetical protein
MCAQSGGRFGNFYPQVGLMHNVKVTFLLALSKTSLQTVRVVKADLSAEVRQVTAVFLQSDTNVFIRREM